ncbi:MAG: YlbF family regulator [Planctomycetes bacterium]|nr:YlbF family regulator [Planctomycetota bacterium]
MDDLDPILTQARELGKKISEHPRSCEFFAAAKAVAEDKDAQAAMRAYQEAVTKLRTLEAQGKPIEPDDKRKAADAERAAAGNEKIKAMMRLQADYMELMHRINAAIDEAAQT